MYVHIIRIQKIIKICLGLKNNVQDLYQLLKNMKHYGIKTLPNGRHHQHEMRLALEEVHNQFKSDDNDVKQQWRNLKDIFYKRYEASLKKVQNEGQPFNKVKPCWVHFDELKFLLINQQLVDTEGRHRRCLTYDINTDDLNNKEEFNFDFLNEGNNLEINEEIINNNNYLLNNNIQENNLIKQQNEQKLLNRKRKNIISLNKEVDNQKEDNKDRFKYFGVFVESAVRDLHQESPELARRLMQNIYSCISSHQIEATTINT
ncbi:MADF domain-containing protein [Meloidogyne graminicola]|uniref:MADF domain-containing protein n=1 Tax=Meloidogyne graminicola TaxID=189291 RepID=A0A8S9ZYN1_9BILA|nr:MADF domain-containing protein [Meloidogyne graminicola]